MEKQNQNLCIPSICIGTHYYDMKWDNFIQLKASEVGKLLMKSPDLLDIGITAPLILSRKVFINNLFNPFGQKEKRLSDFPVSTHEIVERYSFYFQHIAVSLNSLYPLCDEETSA